MRSMTLGGVGAGPCGDGVGPVVGYIHACSGFGATSCGIVYDGPTWGNVAYITLHCPRLYGRGRYTLGALARHAPLIDVDRSAHGHVLV